MKTVRLVCCLLLLVIASAFCLPGIVSAQDDVPALEEKIMLSTLYPRVESIAGGTFEFNVSFQYIGLGSKVFDVTFTAPPGWDTYMTPRYEKEKKISSFTLQPSFTTGEEFRIVAIAPAFPLPEPGDYRITVEAISDTVSGSTDVTAVITAYYLLKALPTNERYDTSARAGEDNVFSIVVANLSTDVVNDINFIANNPEGWSVTFNPDKIEVMEPFTEQTVEVTIKPPSRTVAGDYMMSIRTSATQVSDERMNIRVTVKTPTIWGWVGVGIIIVVVIGLLVVFMRFSRR